MPARNGILITAAAVLTMEVKWKPKPLGPTQERTVTNANQ
jgi:hypothetical protein